MEVKVDKARIILGSLLFIGTGWPLHAEDCPSKIARKLCLEYTGALDSDFLRIRIVLDAASEVQVPKGQKRPLRIWTEDMIAKYDPRTYANRDSAYPPPYSEENTSPSTHSVMYHNVSMQKADIRNLISEIYVSTPFTDPNAKLDPLDMVKHPYIGVYASVSVMDSIGIDNDVKFLERWSVPRPLENRRKSKGSIPAYQGISSGSYLINGRTRISSQLHPWGKAVVRKSSL